MDINWKCDRCGQPLITDSKYAGAKMECPKCKKPLVDSSSQALQEEKKVKAVTSLSERKKLLILLAIAFAIRLFLVFHTYCIAKDGTLYIAIAKDFAAGNFKEGFSGFYPPVYPLLMTLSHSLVSDWELAGQLVSLFLGTLIMIPLYLLGKRIFDQRIALLSVAFFAIHPYLCRYSAEVLSESTYILLLVTAIWLSWEALSKGPLYLYPLIALLSGLAYLTRPEGIGILIVIGLWVLLQDRFEFRQTYKRRLMALCLLILTLPILVFPYMLHLRRETGQWKLSNKRQPSVRAMVGLAGFMKKTEEGRFTLDGSAFPAHLKEYGGTLSQLLIIEVPQGYHGLLLLLLLFGLIRRRAIPYRRKEELFIFSFVVFNVLLFALHRSSHRHVTQLVPISLFWAGAGFYEVHHRICSRLDAKKSKLHLSKRVFVLLMILIVITILPKTLKPQRADKLNRKEAGIWLKEHGSPNPLIMSTMCRIAFYAEGRHLQLWGGYRQLIEYARLKEVDFLVVDEEKIEKVSSDFLDRVDSGELDLVYCTTGPGSRLRIYKLKTKKILDKFALYFYNVVQ